MWFPKLLRAWERYEVVSTDKFCDEFGRVLEEPAFLTFKTDHRNPDLKLTHPYSVLEKQVETEVPVVVTNIDKLTLSYKRLASRERQADLDKDIEIPDVEDVAFRHPLGCGACWKTSPVPYSDVSHLIPPCQLTDPRPSLQRSPRLRSTSRRAITTP